MLGYKKDSKRVYGTIPDNKTDSGFHFEVFPETPRVFGFETRKSSSADRGVVVNIDHILPESKGGTLDPSNLRCVCEDCNLGKGIIVEW